MPSLRCERSCIFSPSSPGEKVNAEQKPSDELIRSVNPSFDLERISNESSISIKMILPCDVCECCKVQIANNAERLLLLCVVHMYRILCCDCIHHAVWQAKS